MTKTAIVGTSITGIVLIAILCAMVFIGEHPGMNASLASVKALDSCGRSVIASLVKNYTGKLATINEVSATEDVCSDIATDRVLLSQAELNNNSCLSTAYSTAIQLSKPDDIAKRMYNFDYGGFVYHVNSHHTSTIGPNGPHEHYTLYYIYSPEAIKERCTEYLKHNTKQQKLNAQLKAEE